MIVRVSGMDNQGVPPGYIRHDGDGSILVVKSDLEATLKPLMETGFPRLSGLPGAHTTAGGRAGPVHLAVAGQSQRIFVRPYAHGGLAGAALGRSFHNPDRALQELQACARATSLGLPVPEMLGLTAHRVSPLRWQMEFWSWWIPDSMTFSLCLRGPSMAPESRRNLLGTVGSAMRTCHEKGLIHRDLNARNIIVMQGASGWSALVVDLDRASFAGGPLPLRSRLRQLRRLYRSLAKEKVIPAAMQPEEYLGLLHDCLGPDYEDGRMRRFLRGSQAAVLWHRLFWR